MFFFFKESTQSKTSKSPFGRPIFQIQEISHDSRIKNTKPLQAFNDIRPIEHKTNSKTDIDYSISLTLVVFEFLKTSYTPICSKHTWTE